MRCDVLAKPMGVIRIFLVVLGVLAIASLFDFKGSFEFTQFCPVAETELHQATIQYIYPFELPAETVPLTQCNTSGHPEIEYPLFFASFKNEAKFFSFMAASSAVVSLVWLIIYVTSWFHYEYDSAMTTADILISLIIALLWLCADCAWASAYTSLKAATTIELLQLTVNGYLECQGGARCTLQDKKEEYARGGFALTVGFCLCFLWFVMALLAYRERSRITIEKRGILGLTRSQAQTQAHMQAQAARVQAERVHAATGQPDFASSVYQ